MPTCIRVFLIIQAQYSYSGTHEFLLYLKYTYLLIVDNCPLHFVVFIFILGCTTEMVFGTIRHSRDDVFTFSRKFIYGGKFIFPCDITAFQVLVIVNIPCFQFFVPLISLEEYQTLNLLSSIRVCVHP